MEAPPDAPALEVTESAGGGRKGEPGAVVVSDAKLNFAPNALLGMALHVMFYYRMIDWPF